MTDEQKAAYVHAQAVCAQIELESMLVKNREREANCLAPAYNGEHFLGLQDKYGLGHNTVMRLFHGQ